MDSLAHQPGRGARRRGRGHGRRSTLLRKLLIGAALAAALLFLSLMLLPLPKSAASWLMGRSAPWLLADYQPDGPATVRAVRKLTGLALQQSLAAHAYRSLRLPPGLPDAQRVGARLDALKPLFISQVELSHGPVNSPVGIAGLGWCDGTNGFAALVLSHEFSRAEIVGVVEPGGNRHSFGRVWSGELSDWLYFDMWADEVVVFRSRRGSPARFLWRSRPLASRAFSPAQQAILARTYDHAFAGIPHNRLQPTLGGYVFSRLLSRESGAAPVPAPASAPQDRSPPGPPAASALYLKARFDHLVGDRKAARRGYARVVAAEPGRPSTYARAARIFADRLERP